MPKDQTISIWAAPLLLALCAVPFGWVGLAAPLIWIALYAIECSRGWKRALAYLVAGLLMLAAALGLAPGSERIELLPAYVDDTGNTIYASFNEGKAVIAIALVAFMLRLRQSIGAADLPYILAAAAIPLASAAALLGLSPKFALAIVVAALINLLVVCISEEGFFRWIMQRGLEEALGRFRWLAVLLVTAMFTFLHTGWAVSAQALALVTVAGLCYSLLWYLRQNFWGCVLAHWSVNLLHMLTLPYPMAA
ncbi:CPBP family intramembrane glutamic endopeptidase [Microbulbifer magnicolonia]|uniref:CPBP family intramembrane glutamic endopeptidase n=1 Tax=Microbulbifer magnicolonia TaxID=3109744 RepID=UPI002B413714|nr:CPBP family intramembrane glutamic endopeptidase [Microbulbifer sp. GG15]